MDNRKAIGITMGDPAGVGAEITVKALSSRAVYEKCIPVVIGDRACMEDAIRFCGSGLKLNLISEPSQAKGEYGTIDMISLGYFDNQTWEYKKPAALCGKASFHYIIHAIELAKKREIEAVITAPINKEALNLGGHAYSGHTEIFADYTDTRDFAMLLASGNLRVIHVSTHVALREACSRVKKERVLKVIRLAHEGLRLLGFEDPTIGVAGLNPHCSENGMFGHEEAEEIIPAIEAARAEGIKVVGPVAPDTVFVKAMGGVYDVVVAMYHDQGHIPLKLAGFRMDPATNTYTSMSGINCTIGLPIIRSSVDHGTAYGKAGEGRANEESMLEAIFAGIEMAKNMFGEE